MGQDFSYVHQIHSCAVTGDKVLVLKPENPGWEEMMAYCHGREKVLAVRPAVWVLFWMRELRLCQREH